MNIQLKFPQIIPSKGLYVKGFELQCSEITKRILNELIKDNNFQLYQHIEAMQFARMVFRMYFDLEIPVIRSGEEEMKMVSVCCGFLTNSTHFNPEDIKAGIKERVENYLYMFIHTSLTRGYIILSSEHVTLNAKRYDKLKLLKRSSPEQYLSPNVVKINLEHLEASFKTTNPID